MKHNSIFAALASLALLTACVGQPFEEITEINLSRCLEPQRLSASVDAATGYYVTFKWDVNKDADTYNLVLATDEDFTAGVLSMDVLSSQVPYTVRLEADNEYFFKVQALSESREPSNWAVYDGSFKTYAVKDNLFPEITSRTSNSVSLKWTKDVGDYKEVTKLSARPVKGGSTVEKNLTEAEINAAAATVTGLQAFTEYQITLFYMSASRGAVDAWTMTDPGSMTQVSTSEALVAAVTAGGEVYLKLSGSPYNLGGSKPTGSVHIVGELGADGSKPVVSGNFDISSICASGMDIICENVLFDDQEVHNHVVNYSGGETTIGTIKFVNCGFTHYKAGLFYNNKTGDGDILTVGDIIFDTCDMYEIATAPGGDCIDFRKGTHSTIKSIQIVNCTIWDGIRTMFRLGDQAGDVTVTDAVTFENNTVKHIVYIDNSNNRGIFAIRVPVTMNLKKNLFLYVDGGKTAADVEDYAQLFQNKGETVIPAPLNASDNYAFACGKDFFIKLDAATAGFKVLNEDPCFNSKGNYFQLADQDLIKDKIGASKWWIPYVQKEEDLTQNVISGAHVWNLQDASLFAGEVKNSRVRDELLLVGTEATPLNADGGIKFLGASALTKKGVPTEGYVSFIVDAPGSVDLQVEKGGASSLAVAIQNSNGFEVIGAVAASGQGVQKVLLPAIAEETVVMIYSTGAISLTKLAWSLDAVGGNRVLATPAPAVDPVTIAEGDATAVTVSWAAVEHAALYSILFKGKEYKQTETSLTLAAEDIAALKAGLYTVTVQALPEDGDIYYTKSEQGKASFAVQPKGGGGEVVNVDYVWDFSAADWQTEFGKAGTVNTDIASGDISYDNLNIHWATKCKYNTTFFQFAGAGVNASSGNLDRYFKFTAPAAGKLTVTASNTGGSEDATRKVYVKVGESVFEQVGGVASTAPVTLEYDVDAGDVYISTTGNGLRFYKIEFHCSYTNSAPAPVEYDWNFSAADWQAEFGKAGTVNTDIATGDINYDNLNIHWATKCKYNTTFFQFAGAGVNASSGNLDRYFKFTAPVAGKLTVTASNTGSSEDATRKVYVKVGDVVTEKVGGVASTAPVALEYDVDAGDVYISTTGNGLRFYSISFKSN